MNRCEHLRHTIVEKWWICSDCGHHWAASPFDLAQAQLLTDALDFIEDSEFGGWMSDGPVDVISTCLDCGAQKGATPEENHAHSENCRWLALMRRSGRRG